MARQTRSLDSQRYAHSALDLLKKDHAEAKKLFREFEKRKKDNDAEGMSGISQKVCKALAIHAQIEEEIFYPALRAAGNAEDALDEANVEHSHVKELVAQIEDSSPDEGLFSARMKVLSEYVQHHVEEEESTVFSKARKADVDLTKLGEQLFTRKTQLEENDEGVAAGRTAAAPRAPTKRAGSILQR